jgi:hypothetical protein
VCSGDDGFDVLIERHHDASLRRMGPLMVKRILRDDWGCVTGKEARKRNGT